MSTATLGNGRGRSVETIRAFPRLNLGRPLRGSRAREPDSLLERHVRYRPSARGPLLGFLSLSLRDGAFASEWRARRWSKIKRGYRVKSLAALKLGLVRQGATVGSQAARREFEFEPELKPAWDPRKLNSFNSRQ
jgi:hypothetical protein